MRIDNWGRYVEDDERWATVQRVLIVLAIFGAGLLCGYELYSIINQSVLWP